MEQVYGTLDLVECQEDRRKTAEEVVERRLGASLSAGYPVFLRNLVWLLFSPPAPDCREKLLILIMFCPLAEKWIDTHHIVSGRGNYRIARSLYRLVTRIADFSLVEDRDDSLRPLRNLTKRLKGFRIL